MNNKNIELKNEIKFCIKNIDYLQDILEKNDSYNSLIRKHILILLKVNYIKIQDNLNSLLFKKNQSIYIKKEVNIISQKKA
jgi:hypothetical protein